MDENRRAIANAEGEPTNPFEIKEDQSSYLCKHLGVCIPTLAAWLTPNYVIIVPLSVSALFCQCKYSWLRNLACLATLQTHGGTRPLFLLTTCAYDVLKRGYKCVMLQSIE